MDREVLCESLILWVETFNLEVPHRTAEELSDGVAMAKVLQQIAPDYFNETWLSRIKSDEVTNWRLKVSNLKKILKGILEYNIEVLGIQIHDFQMPDVNAIGEHSNHGELGRLLQLILGCAVNCSEKQEYIQRIMAMEESVQHVVMTAIQELMTKEMATDPDSEVGEQLKRTIEELNGALEAKEELMQRCHELDQQVTALMEEKHSLGLENERLAERLNQAENLDDPSTPAGKRFQQLQHQLEQLQEENYKLDTAKDDYRIKVEVLQKESNDLKDKNTELAVLADESRSLKDELDVLRHTAEQVVRYEAQLESYKKRMDELSDIRGQVKLLEDKNTKYMQENLDLQEDVRKSNTVKQQLEVYKRQVHEFQSRLTEETKRADKSEFEANRVQEKMLSVQKEKERLATELQSLKEVNEELVCTQLQTTETSAEEMSTSPGLEMLSLPPVIKEKMLRLEHENKMLKLKDSGESDDQCQILQTMLDDSNARKNELETDLRLANQKIMAVEAELEDLRETQKSTVSSTELVDLKKKLNEQVALVQQRDLTIEKERSHGSELQTELSASKTRVEDLQDELSKKNEEMKMMEERYKRYLDKAKSVIKMQDQKAQSTDSYAKIQTLRSQLQEKERYIEHLEADQEKAKSIREQEERLLTTSWYDLGMRLCRQGVEDRLANGTSGQSFLARQRQAHIRRPQAVPNSLPNASSLSDGACPDPHSSTHPGDWDTHGNSFLAWHWLEMVKEAGLDRRPLSDLNQLEAEGESGLPVYSGVHHLLASHAETPVAAGDCQEEDDELMVKDNLEESPLSPVATNTDSVFTLCIPETPDYQQRKSRVRTHIPSDQASFSARDMFPGLENKPRNSELDAVNGRQNNRKQMREETSNTILSYITSKFSFSQVLEYFLKVNGAEMNSESPINKQEEDSFKWWESLTTSSSPSCSLKSLENSPRAATNIAHQDKAQTGSVSPSCPEHTVSLNPTPDQDGTSDSVSLQEKPCIQVNDGTGLIPDSEGKSDIPSTDCITEGNISTDIEDAVVSQLIPDAAGCNELQVTPQTGPDNKLLMVQTTGRFSEGHIELKIGCSDDRSVTPVSRKGTAGAVNMRSPFVMKQHTGLVTKRRRRRRQSGVGDQSGTGDETSSPTCKQLCQWQDVSELSLSEVECQGVENQAGRPAVDEESLVTEKPVVLTTAVSEDCQVKDKAAN